MKVSEAKTKVCPFMQRMSFVVSSIVPKTNREIEAIGKSNSPANITCNCGDCMAWEYTKTHEEIYNGKKDIFSEDVISCQIKQGLELPTDDKEGFCKRLQK